MARGKRPRTNEAGPKDAGSKPQARPKAPRGSAEEFVFAPLGGVGEIGMNLSLYGYGTPAKKDWIAVDCGVAFAGPELPGIDLVMPDPSFIEGEKKRLRALIITHAHEDHIGAVADLWPRLGCPIYLTPFAAAMLETKRLSEAGAPKIPIRVIRPGERVELGPFAFEPIRSRNRPHSPSPRRSARSFIPVTGRSTRPRCSARRPMKRGSGRWAMPACSP